MQHEPPIDPRSAKPVQLQTGLVTLVFTDIVGSSGLKQQLGDRVGARLMEQHHQLVRETLRAFAGGKEVETAGDSFLIMFTTPSEAVTFALRLQGRLRQLNREQAVPVLDRVGIHLGEVFIREHAEGLKPRDLYGSNVDVCSRVMSLAKGGQVLLSRGVFDSARQVLKGEDIEGIKTLEWLNHGPYLLRGLDEPVEICEVREAGQEQAPGPPTTSEKAQRQVRPDEEPVLGWRPAVGQLVPNTRWFLERKLGEGGFGEVWLGRNPTTKQASVFKFCFQAERVRFLKRELTLFRLLKERVGDHPNVVAIHDVYLDRPPFYVEMEYVEGKDLRSWCEDHGGVAAIPVETRLEIVAQVADALQAAHDAGIIHRDVKPANILIGGKGIGPTEVRVKITDFGIGQVVSEECLKGITRAGFTQTVAGNSSSSHTGTQLYMAPELLAGKPASTRSDIYSLGVVLYQVLVGDLTRPVTTDWARDVSDPLLREDLAHCFAGNPHERFVGAGQLSRNLRQLHQRKEARARHEAELAANEKAAYRRGVIRTATVAVLIVIAVGLLAIYALTESHRADVNARNEAKQRETAERNLYAADMILASEALEASNLGHARRLIRKYLPNARGKDLRGWEWRYLWQQCQGDESFTLGTHDKGVTVGAFFPDGQTVASASKDKTAKLWDLKSRRCIGTLPHLDQVHALAIAPSGKLLATGCDDGIVRVWEVGTKEIILSFTNASYVNAVVFSSDGKIVAAAGAGRVGLWDMGTRAELAHFEGGSGPLGFKTGLALSSDNQYLAFTRGRQVEIWDWAVKVQRSTLAGHVGGTLALAFSADGKLLVSGGYDRMAKVWNIATGQEVHRLTNFLFWVGSVTFSPDGRTLATASADQTVKLWDTRTWEELVTLRGHEFEVWTVAFSPDGSRLVTASKDDTIKIWNTNTRREQNVVKLPFAGTMDHSFSPDGKTLLLVGTNGSFSVADTAKFAVPERVSLPLATNRNIVTLSDQRRLVALSDRNGLIRLFDLNSSHELTGFSINSPPLLDLLLSPNAKTLAAENSQRKIELWDTGTSRLARVLEIRDRASAWGFSPDSRRIAIGYYDATVDLWDLGKGSKTTFATGHQERIMGIAFSHNRKTMATMSVDVHLLKLWNIETGRELAALGGQLAQFNSVAFSSDDHRLAAGGNDGSITLWDINSPQPQEVCKLKGHTGEIERVFFLPNEDTIVSLADDGIRVLRAPSWAEIDAAEKAQARAQ